MTPMIEIQRGSWWPSGPMASAISRSISWAMLRLEYWRDRRSLRRWPTPPDRPRYYLPEPDDSFCQRFSQLESILSKSESGRLVRWVRSLRAVLRSFEPSFVDTSDGGPESVVTCFCRADTKFCKAKTGKKNAWRRWSIFQAVTKHCTSTPSTDEMGQQQRITPPQHGGGVGSGFMLKI
uniref:Uncharacterized protein n=1 Tax=Anopheles coluzzii TaxID=1518534 RepID=A0A8W7PHH4_ANOCL